MKSQENAKGVNVRSDIQATQECKHMDDWWLCQLTKDEREFYELCDYYPHCEDCPRFTPKNDKK